MTRIQQYNSTTTTTLVISVLFRFTCCSNVVMGSVMMKTRLNISVYLICQVHSTLWSTVNNWSRCGKYM